MKVLIEVPASCRCPTIRFTEWLAPPGFEMTQNNTKITTRKPQILLSFMVNHSSWSATMYLILYTARTTVCEPTVGHIR